MAPGDRETQYVCEGLVSLPAWTESMHTALHDGGVAAAVPDGVSAEPVVVRVQLPARGPEQAIETVRGALSTHVELGLDAFSDFVCDSVTERR
jgi:hypothetical protein